MRRRTYWQLLFGGLVVAAATSYGYRTMTPPQWTTVATDFMANDKPYGGGAFRLRDDEVMTLKVADPEVRYRVVELDKGYDKAQAIPEEAWMDDTLELLNRSTVSFLRGSLKREMRLSFRQPAQNTAWWYSKDWSTIYVASDWMNYKAAAPKKGAAPHVAKLWRSANGGKTWAHLKWPEDRNINALQFLDSQRGYAIGWGPQIWRTTDGGQTWQEIALPPVATDYRQPRKTFDAVDLGPDGTLRVAYYVGMLGDIRLSSVVYRLGWGEMQFEKDVVLPNQVVVQIGTTDEPPGHTYSVYALSRLGPQRNYNDHNDNGDRVGAISTWPSYKAPTVEQLHTFDQRYRVGGLSVGKRGVLLVYATDSSREGAPHDITFFSQEFGKSWKNIDDGMRQGGWFDSQTNTQYALYAYTLKKRQF